ncbi:DUF948 domain-containing protein [Rossellomorea aquimaris]|uniref:DUF948 domain-containing protein n=1 Tax=Rossellomorea aquimaris TaxID=189382 RepID=UPI0007D0A783|nr:DUF948 domain-containing protein [Rossellomorea aquimaris]
MWIVYASIGLVVISIIILSFTLIQTLKTTRPMINNMNQTVLNIQNSIDGINSEANQLQATQVEIQEDIEDKKLAITNTINEVKQTPNVLKEFMKSMKK